MSFALAGVRIIDMTQPIIKLVLRVCRWEAFIVRVLRGVTLSPGNAWGTPGAIVLLMPPHNHEERTTISTGGIGP